MGGSPASLWIYVEDCDALFNRAVAAGAQVLGGPWGRWRISSGAIARGTFTDPQRLPVDDRDAQGRSDAARKWSSGRTSG